MLSASERSSGAESAWVAVAAVVPIVEQPIEFKAARRAATKTRVFIADPK